METYPKTISKPPATVNGARVLAWAEVRHSEGNYPGGNVLAYMDKDYPEYITWGVYTKDGGESWFAFSGHYMLDHDAAFLDFVDRCKYGLAER